MVRAGAVLIVPCKVKGCGIYFGDMHAMQGDGEIAGHTTDVSGTITTQVHVLKGLSIEVLECRLTREGVQIVEGRMRSGSGAVSARLNGLSRADPHSRMAPAPAQRAADAVPSTGRGTAPGTEREVLVESCGRLLRNSRQSCST